MRLPRFNKTPLERKGSGDLDGYPVLAKSKIEVMNFKKGMKEVKL